MTHVHLVVPAHGKPALTRCAINAIERTTPEPHTIWIVEDDESSPRRWGGLNVKGLVIPCTWPAGDGAAANAAKLNAVLARPEVSGWLFSMHNDSAPLEEGWLSWLHSHPLNLLGISLGASRSIGALYPVPYLRACGFDFRCAPNPGDAIQGVTVYPRDMQRIPWWLHNCEVYRNEAGKIVYAHLGGGTIGAGGWRMPAAIWPQVVRSYLRRNGL